MSFPLPLFPRTPNPDIPWAHSLEEPAPLPGRQHDSSLQHWPSFPLWSEALDLSPHLFYFLIASISQQGFSPRQQQSLKVMITHHVS